MQCARARGAHRAGADKADPRAVAAAAIGGNRKPRGLWIARASHRLPPAANGVDREARRVVVDAQAHPTALLAMSETPPGSSPGAGSGRRSASGFCRSTIGPDAIVARCIQPARHRGRPAARRWSDRSSCGNATRYNSSSTVRWKRSQMALVCGLPGLGAGVVDVRATSLPRANSEPKRMVHWQAAAPLPGTKLASCPPCRYGRSAT